MQTNDSGHVAGGKTEADTSAHTATPWSIRDGVIISLPAEIHVATMAHYGQKYQEMREEIETGDFIVRACNVHAELIALLKEQADKSGGDTITYEWLARVNVALAKAGAA